MSTIRPSVEIEYWFFFCSHKKMLPAQKLSQFPKEIVPNPILTSTVEIRFEDDFLFDTFEGQIFEALQSAFGLEKSENLYEEEDSEKGEKVKYVILKNNMFSISFFEQSIIFDNVESYHLWSKYFDFIIKSFNIVKSIINNISLKRIGLRYVSFFEKIEDQKLSILKKPFFMVDDELDTLGEIKDQNFFGIYNFSVSNFDYSITIGNKLEQSDSSFKDGCIIDLDISKSKELPSTLNDEVLSTIDDLHTREKALFLQLLNIDFMKTLNVHY